MRLVFPALIVAVGLTACNEEPNRKTVENPVQSVPAEPRADCPKSRARLYGECLDQRQVLADALALANRNGKTVLVSFGAEWCVWCHLLDRHLKGETMQRFDYTYDGETYLHEEPRREADAKAAKALGAYMAENFVLAHIDADNAFGVQPDGGTGWDAVDGARAAEGFEDWLPYVFAVTPKGEFLAVFDTRQAEKKDEATGYRGYDRRILLTLAEEIRAAARAGE